MTTKYGVMLVSYEGMGQMNMWLRDDIEGTHIASFSERVRAVQLAESYRKRNPKGNYQVLEAPEDPEAPDGQWVRPGEG